MNRAKLISSWIGKTDKLYKYYFYIINFKFIYKKNNFKILNYGRFIIINTKKQTM